MKVVFFFVIHLHLGVKSFYTYVTIQSSLLQTATGLCLVCNSKRNNRTIEYQLKLLLKLFKRISIDILLFTVSQISRTKPPRSTSTAILDEMLSFFPPSTKTGLTERGIPVQLFIQSHFRL